MKVSELGEFGLIDLLAKMIAEAGCHELTPERPVIGIGDDATAWKCDRPIQLATVDTMVQDVHFTLEMTTWRELGWKSLAINLSDIAAMGGVPEYALLALALPETTDVENVTEMYHGIIDLALEANTAIVGGNISRSPLISITITVLGGSLGNEMLRRDTAQPSDCIAITGYPGSAAAGLETLTKNTELSKEDSLYLRKAFLWPVPRIKEGQILIKRGIRTAIDTSDGLLADLRHICEASRVGARVEAEKIPIHPAIKRNFPSRAREMALSGGEDYALLFTGQAAIIAKLRTEMEIPVTVIGEITSGEPGRIEVVDAAGNPLEIGRPGWRHF